MSYKSIIWYGIGSYLTTMIVGIIYAVSSGIDMTATTTMSDEMRYYSVVISVVVTLLWCWCYFYKRKHVASFAHGIEFGVGVTILAFFLDAIMWLPFVSQSGSYEQLRTYYADWRFRAAVVLIIAGCGVVGKLVQRYHQ